MITVTYNPQDDIWSCPSKMLLESQPNEEVLAAFDQAIRVRPNQYQLWYFRGWILSKLGRYDEAIASLDRALQIRPDRSQAWYNRGLVLLQ
jgi:tetratricopeptide (TPR) repeat protein